MSSEVLGPEPCLAEASYATLAKINAMIDGLTDEWQRKILTNWRDHYWGEVVGDLDGIMATLAPDPVYKLTNPHGVRSFDTTEGARALYAGLIDIGYRPAGPMTDIKVAFADWGLMAQGATTGVYPGTALRGPDIDPKASYRVTRNIMESHPYTPDGLMAGEIVFMSEPTEVVRVER
jgi:hypothetical protein